MSEKIAIIDTDSIIYSSFYGKKVVDDVTGEPQKIDGKFVIVPKTDEEIAETFDGIMYHIFNEGGFTHYIAFVKGENTIKDRLSINPDYKQQRTKETPEKWEFTKKYAIERWGVIEVNDIEVDDAVRITSLHTPNSHIVAIDKDLLWLAGENFNWRKNEWNKVSLDDEDRYLAVSMICGDTVDNLPGLLGKGEKYCEKQGIKTLPDVLRHYIAHYNDDLKLAVTEFNKHFQCLFILTKSDKFTKIPTPIKIDKTEDNESEIIRSRSSSGKLHNP